MTQDIFENTLRNYLRSKPFHPFQVELLDGTTILIEHPKLAIGGDSAALINGNDELIEFDCEDVRDIRHLPIPSL